MFPFAELMLYTLLMVAWIEKHPSRKLLVMLALAWLAGRITDGFTYSRPWDFRWEWVAILLVIWLWAGYMRKKGNFALLVVTLTITGQYLFILNEPGIIPYQELLFPLMAIIIAWILTDTFFELAFALSGALLINQIFVIYSFDGIVRYFQLPEPHYFHGIMIFLGLLAFYKRQQLWPETRPLDKPQELNLHTESGTVDLPERYE